MENVVTRFIYTYEYLLAIRYVEKTGDIRYPNVSCIQDKKYLCICRVRAASDMGTLHDLVIQEEVQGSDSDNSVLISRNSQLRPITTLSLSSECRRLMGSLAGLGRQFN